MSLLSFLPFCCLEHEDHLSHSAGWWTGSLRASWGTRLPVPLDRYGRGEYTWVQELNGSQPRLTAPEFWCRQHTVSEARTVVTKGAWGDPLGSRKVPETLLCSRWFLCDFALWLPLRFISHCIIWRQCLEEEMPWDLGLCFMWLRIPTIWHSVWHVGVQQIPVELMDEVQELFVNYLLY